MVGRAGVSVMTLGLLLAGVVLSLVFFLIKEAIAGVVRNRKHHGKWTGQCGQGDRRGETQAFNEQGINETYSGPFASLVGKYGMTSVL